MNCGMKLPIISQISTVAPSQCSLPKQPVVYVKGLHIDWFTRHSFATRHTNGACWFPYASVNLIIYTSCIGVPFSNNINLFCHVPAPCIRRFERGHYRPVRCPSIYMYMITSWDRKFSVSLVPCERNPPVIGEFLSQRTGNAGLWYFPWCESAKAAE